MSYDFYISVDTGGKEPHSIEPFFDGRCGNYTSNVSGMWARCLTAALEKVPEASKWIGVDDRRSIERWGPVATYAGGEKRPRTIATDRLYLRDLHGAVAGELTDLLAAAVEWGTTNLPLLREDNPENGWGDADGAVTYLHDLLRFCSEHPRGQLAISS